MQRRSTHDWSQRYPACGDYGIIKPELAQEGVDLQIKVFTDYAQPNVEVAEKHLDANFFEHLPFLTEFNKDRNQNLVPIVPVFIAPFGAY